MVNLWFFKVYWLKADRKWFGLLSQRLMIKTVLNKSIKFKKWFKVARKNSLSSGKECGLEHKFFGILWIQKFHPARKKEWAARNSAYLFNSFRGKSPRQLLTWRITMSNGQHFTLQSAIWLQTVTNYRCDREKGSGDLTGHKLLHKESK